MKATIQSHEVKHSKSVSGNGHFFLDTLQELIDEAVQQGAPADATVRVSYRHSTEDSHISVHWEPTVDTDG